MSRGRNSRGETLLEALCAILVITLVVVCLLSAAAAAARVNAQAEAADTSYTMDRTDAEEGTITITWMNEDPFPDENFSGDIQVYEDNGYVFYDHG